jgi:hypothetical protein
MFVSEPISIFSFGGGALLKLEYLNESSVNVTVTTTVTMTMTITVTVTVTVIVAVAVTVIVTVTVTVSVYGFNHCSCLSRWFVFLSGVYTDLINEIFGMASYLHGSASFAHVTKFIVNECDYIRHALLCLSQCVLYGSRGLVV